MDVQYQRRTLSLENGCYCGRLCHCCCAYTPTSNTASHDNHEKINSWVSFSFLYEYGDPLGCWSSTNILSFTNIVVHLLLECYAGVSLMFSGGGQLLFTGRQISLNLKEKRPSRWTDQAGKIILTTGPFVQCLALNETCCHVDERVQNVDHENDVTAVMLGLQKALVYHVQYLSIFGCMCHCRGVKNMRTCKSCAFLSALELDR